MQNELWKQKRILEPVKHFRHLKLLGKIDHGCDAVVFKCSPILHNVDAQPLAAKVLINYGIETLLVGKSFEKEYQILKSLPFHPNIIPILREFTDRPPQEYIDLFPADVQSLAVKEVGGETRMTLCILMPILESFEEYLRREFSRLGIKKKIAFISDVASALKFLFDYNVVHRDMKLNNLLIDSAGRIILSDFGHALQTQDDKKMLIHPKEGMGGNPRRLAPEIKSINLRQSTDAIMVDYSKQPSFELGMIAFEVLFGKLPELSEFGETMDNAYFNKICLTGSQHLISPFFGWIQSLLFEDPSKRVTLDFAIKQFNQIMKKLDAKKAF